MSHPVYRILWKGQELLKYILIETYINLLCQFHQINTLGIPQDHQVVPQTPLMSAQVLREEEDTWMDVQVQLYFYP